MSTLADKAAQLDLIARLNAARRQIDADTYFLNRALDIREQLRWGIFDLGEAIAEVGAFQRDCRAHMRGSQ
jgi:hypothetical protein